MLAGGGQRPTAWGPTGQSPSGVDMGCWRHFLLIGKAKISHSGLQTAVDPKGPPRPRAPTSQLVTSESSCGRGAPGDARVHLAPRTSVLVASRLPTSDLRSLGRSRQGVCLSLGFAEVGGGAPWGWTGPLFKCPLEKVPRRVSARAPSVRGVPRTFCATGLDAPMPALSPTWA